MGRALHIEVVAEGVETETQQAVLLQMQCDHYQGFLCAPGLPADDFRRLLGRPSGAAPGVPALQPAVARRSSEPED
jgi:EAL domain-containing protein (putative c-di-GMP-specific phosphodiesterase class I)